MQSELGLDSEVIRSLFPVVQSLVLKSAAQLARLSFFIAIFLSQDIRRGVDKWLDMTHIMSRTTESLILYVSFSGKCGTTCSAKPRLATQIL